MPFRPPPPGVQPLRRVRLGQNLTQKDVADRVGIDQATVSRLEAGVYIPTPEQLAGLVKALRARPADLFAPWVLKEVARRASVAQAAS